jgi:hypothetical protein
MPIIGFGFDKFFVEKTKNLAQEDQIKNNIKIESIEESKLNIGLEQRESLTVFFDFLIEYGEAAKVDIKGHILFFESPELIKEIITKWKEEQKVPPQFSAMVYNYTIMKASVKAFQLEEDVGLPLHLSLPRIMLKPKDSSEGTKEGENPSQTN